MASSARFLYRNLCASATLAVSSEAAGYPKAKAVTIERNEVWRSDAGATDQWLEVDFGGSKTVKGIAAVNVTPHGGGTLTAQYWNGAAYVTFAVMTPSTAGRTRLRVVYGSQATTKIRFYFTNTASVAAAVELGVAYAVEAAGYLEPTALLSNLRGILPEDLSEVRVSRGGQMRANRRQKIRTLTGAWPVLPAADEDAIESIWDLVGATEPIIFAQQAVNLDQTVYGCLSAKPAYQHVAGGQWAFTVAVREAA